MALDGRRRTVVAGSSGRMDLETQMEAGCLLDPATEAAFMETWLNFLLFWIFRRDVYLSLGVDIEKRLGDYILGGGQPPDVAYMASCFQQQFNRTCENPRYVEVMGNMEQAIQKKEDVTPFHEDETYRLLAEILERLIRISKEDGLSTSGKEANNERKEIQRLNLSTAPSSSEEPVAVSDRIFFGHLMESLFHSEEDDDEEIFEVEDLFEREGAVSYGEQEGDNEPLSYPEQQPSVGSSFPYKSQPPGADE